MKRALFLLLLAAPAAAIEPYKPGEDILSISLGGTSSGNEYDWSRYGGRSERAGDPGGHLGLQWMHFLAGGPAVAVGADLNLAGLDWHEADGAVPDRHSRSKYGSLILMPMARIGRTGGRVRPYGFAGVGLHSTKLQLELKPINGTTWNGGGTETRKITDGTGTGAAVSFGGGLDVFLNDSFFLGSELRVNYLGEADYGVTDEGRAAGFGEAKNDLSNVSLALKAGVRF